ncbi:hypothetical protein YC2023_061591 [Brassica napus]
MYHNPRSANCETFPKMPIHVEVSNTGEFDGTHTVFVFAEAPRNGIKGLGVNKQLIAFEKVHVTAGAKRTVQVDVDACKHLGVVDEYGKRRIPMGEHKVRTDRDRKGTNGSGPKGYERIRTERVRTDRDRKGTKGSEPKGYESFRTKRVRTVRDKKGVNGSGPKECEQFGTEKISDPTETASPRSGMGTSANDKGLCSN